MFLYKYKREVKKMAEILLFVNTVTDAYKQTSEALNSVDLNNKHVIKKTLVEIMRQSFFHGASRFGTNFIA